MRFLVAGLLSLSFATAIGFGAQAQALFQIRKKAPKPVPGRVHLLNGSSRTALLVYVDYNKITAVENGVETTYTPLEVSSFVMQQDSFIVLKDFKVAIGSDEQEFRLAFVQVGVVGPAFALYHFNGTMRREQAGYVVSGPGGMAMGRTQESTQYLMSKVWFVKKTDDPRWRSLPNEGRGLTAILEPLIADDKKLSRSVDWTFLTADEVPKILVKYLANKAVAN